MKYYAIIHEAEEGGYWAEIPAMPGCATQAETIEQLKINLKEAAEGWMEAQKIKAKKEGKRLVEIELP